MVILRLIHLIFGTIWVGGGFYYNFILQPRLRRMETGTRRAVSNAVTQTMAPLLGISAVLTIVSGGVMMALLRGDHGPNFLTTGWGISMIVGLITSLVAVVLVFTVEVPAVRKAEELAASMEGRNADEAERQELARISDRAYSIGRLGTVLLLIALASMAVARFV